MEAMRSAARIKSGCVLLSGVGNEAPSAGWGAVAGGIYNGTTVSMLGISSLEMRRKRGQNKLVVSGPSPKTQGKWQ